MEETKTTPESEKTFKKHMVGDALISKGFISETQLKTALEQQRKMPGKQIGAVLVELGFLPVEQLISYLSEEFGVPGVNLYEINITQETLDLIPAELITSSNILPIKSDATTITLAMVNPQNVLALSDLEFSIGKKIKTAVIPSIMMEAALKLLSSDYKDGLDGEAVASLVATIASTTTSVADATNLNSIISYAVRINSSDIFLTAGAPASLKIGNEVIRMKLPTLTPFDCETYAQEILTNEEWPQYMANKQIDTALTVPNVGRFRVNVFQQRNSVSIALRTLPENIPSLEELNLPSYLSAFALKPSGMIIASGPAGQGKSTTLCAMLDIINTNRRCNVITLEDPVEYLHKHKKSNINQREVGRDTPSFAEGMRTIFRQAPDVIVVGEMRDVESCQIALQAADTGHLVFTTVHADYSTSTIERMINMFPADRQGLIRMMLADALQIVLSQRLVPRKKGGRVLALEKLVNSHRIKKFIREGKTHQIRSQMQPGSEDFTSMDLALGKLYRRGEITYENGRMYAESESFFEEQTKRSKTEKNILDN